MPGFQSMSKADDHTRSKDDSQDVSAGRGRKCTPLSNSSCTRRVHNSQYSVTKNIFGKLEIMSKSCRVLSSSSDEAMVASMDDQYEFETKCVLHPAWWLVKLGLSTGIRATISRSIMGWDYQLRPFQAVPDDSLIFEFCRAGNIDGVRALFERGQASPWDTNFNGITPLHVSANVHH